MLSLTFTVRARKDLRGLPIADRQRIADRLKAYAATPDAAGHDAVPLAGTPGGFRLRSGDWRALFMLSGEEMTVYRVGHRREIYR
ncbi:MAG: type II toxin-antitoxin system RelE family toxin [Stellaceae bacterium]